MKIVKVLRQGLTPKLIALYALTVLVIGGWISSFQPAARAVNSDPAPTVNITAHWPGTMASPGTAVSESDEDTASNLIISVNDDHDENLKKSPPGPYGETPWYEDKWDLLIRAEDDDIVTVKLKVTTPVQEGTVTLETVYSGLYFHNSSGMRLDYANNTVDLSAPTGPLEKIATSGVTLYAEGHGAKKDGHFKLSYAYDGQTYTDTVKAHVILAKFDEIADNTGFGYDKYNNSIGWGGRSWTKYHWMSVKYDGNDKAMCNIGGQGLESFVNFRSTDQTNMRILPTPATSKEHELTCYGDSVEEGGVSGADGEAHTSTVLHDTLKVQVYEEKTVKVSIQVIHSKKPDSDERN